MTSRNVNCFLRLRRFCILISLSLVTILTVVEKKIENEVNIFTHVNFSTSFLADDKSSVKTGTSLFSNAAGLTGWRWELAYLYTDCMTSVCMNGQSSVIQKTALLGSEANRKVTVYGKRNAMSSEGLGLLDLLKIKLPVVEGIVKASFALFLLLY